MILFSQNMAGRYIVKDAVFKCAEVSRDSQRRILAALENASEDRYDELYEQACKDVDSARAAARADMLHTCKDVPDAAFWINYYSEDPARYEN